MSPNLNIAEPSAFLITFISLRFLFGKEDRKINVKEIYDYTYPVLVAIVCLSILINFPTILVKHYFSSLEAGYWNAALTIARLIGFVSAAFSGVMFAKVAEGHERKEETMHFLNKSLIYAGICSLGFLGLIWLFPEFVVKLLIIFKNPNNYFFMEKPAARDYSSFPPPALSLCQLQYLFAQYLKPL